MHQVRQVHRWLFGVAIVLTVLAVPHVAWVYAQHLPTAFVNLNMITALGFWIYGELRRQRWERSKVQGDLTELVAAAERR